MNLSTLFPISLPEESAANEMRLLFFGVRGLVALVALISGID